MLTYTNHYFIGRTRRNITYTDPDTFEEFNVNKIKYFLYLNNSDQAVDAADQKNSRITTNLEELCGIKSEFDPLPEFADQASALVKIRSNTTSFFIKLSEMLVIFLMSIFTLFNTFYVPTKLREYQIPIIFRNPETNEWYDRQRVHNVIFGFTIILGGCLPNLSFYTIGAPCLNTLYPDEFTIQVCDKYQYLTAVLLWVVVLPIFFMILSVVIRDQSRLICYPIFIAVMIFGFIMSFMSFYILYHVLWMSHNPYLRWVHWANIVCLVVSIAIGKLYYLICDKRDLIRERDDDGEVEIE